MKSVKCRLPMTFQGEKQKKNRTNFHFQASSESFGARVYLHTTFIIILKVYTVHPALCDANVSRRWRGEREFGSVSIAIIFGASFMSLILWWTIHIIFLVFFTVKWRNPMNQNNDNKPRREIHKIDDEFYLSRDIKVGWLEAHGHRREGESRAFLIWNAKTLETIDEWIRVCSGIEALKNTTYLGLFFCLELPPLHFVMSSQLSADDETMKKLCSTIFYICSFMNTKNSFCMMKRRHMTTNDVWVGAMQFRHWGRIVNEKSEPKSTENRERAVLELFRHMSTCRGGSWQDLVSIQWGISIL